MSRTFSNEKNRNLCSICCCARSILWACNSSLFLIIKKPETYRSAILHGFDIIRQAGAIQHLPVWTISLYDLCLQQAWACYSSLFFTQRTEGSTNTFYKFCRVFQRCKVAAMGEFVKTNQVTTTFDPFFRRNR